MQMARSLIFTLALIAAMPSWAVVTDEAISNVITRHQQAVKHYARAQNKQSPCSWNINMECNSTWPESYVYRRT